MEKYRDRKEYQRLHYLKNKERKLLQRKIYLETNKEKAYKKQRECGARWFKENKEKVYAYRKNRLKTNVSAKISETLRKRLKAALSREYKTGSAINLLGCSIDYFKEYIEKQFREGMTWDNHGKDIWHIDHIKPCDSFDLTKESEQIICFHYTNMQPLFALENYSKGKKL